MVTVWRPIEFILTTHPHTLSLNVEFCIYLNAVYRDCQSRVDRLPEEKMIKWSRLTEMADFSMKYAIIVISEHPSQH